jgi:hypothetical protein
MGWLSCCSREVVSLVEVTDETVALWLPAEPIAEAITQILGIRGVADFDAQTL